MNEIMEVNKRLLKNRALIFIGLYRCVALAIVFSTVFATTLDGNVLDEGNLPQNLQDIPEGWQSLFDGKTLTNWKILRYGGNGTPYVRNGALVLPKPTEGVMTGVCWIGDALPENNYEVYYEARRVAGTDIFAGFTFPYSETSASLVFGGWGGVVNGLSSIDGLDASENETCQRFSWPDNRWYPVQLRVTPDSICASVGVECIVNIATAGKDIHLRADYLDTGFTLWTYNTTGEIRNIRIRKIF